MKQKIYILLFLAFSINSFSQIIEELDHDLYHQFQGDYKFEDGTYLTGGPMGEIKGSLVFLEPENRNMGGVFIPETSSIFKSAFPPESKTKIQFHFNDKNQVEGLWWIGEKGNRKYAVKEISPVVKQVKFSNGDITLAGELHLPKGEGPFPAIINIHGSGRQNRHFGPWTSFFTRYGIAVLSYDKRGVEGSTGTLETAGYEDLASDVLSGIEFLKSDPNINKNLIGIHASSEGGWVGAIAASRSSDIAFLIVRVGSGVSGFETYMHEVKNELAAKDLTKQEWVEAVKLERDYYKLALSDATLDSINSFIRDARTKRHWFTRAFGDWNQLKPQYRIKMKETGPIDPAESLRKITVPVLWFLAEKDENVPYELSLPRIKLALKEAGNENYEIITIKNASHNFILEDQDGNPKYVDGYWDKMASWLIKNRFTKTNN